MFFSSQKPFPYSVIPNSDSVILPRKRFPHLRLICITSAAACFSVVAFFIIFLFSSPRPQSRCTQPRVRPEWRTLSPAHKAAYLSASNCLTKTARKNPNISIHDEFSYVHSRIGNYSHNAAPFLPWHRYFLHAYEKALGHYCNYTGPLPYWDWSLDYRSLTSSPIWNTHDGFGPSGSSSPSVANGLCVSEGPFASWTPAYYEGNYHPHCLSRGFLDEATVARVGNLTVRPDILQDVIRKESRYFDFLLAVETMSHLTIPYVVQGDFSKVTAPNDPVFFLHHAQVDRVWWSWQAVVDERRWQYNGIARNDSTAEAGLDNILEFGYLLEKGAAVKVEDVMDIEGGLLCYRYDKVIEL